jgi:hypothetical protein
MCPMTTRDTTPRVSTKPRVAEAPHSWSIEEWPSGVFPNTPQRARWLIREHKNELIDIGALARPGRELLIFGQPYCAWLASKKSRAAEFRNGAARSRSAA